MFTFKGKKVRIREACAETYDTTQGNNTIGYPVGAVGVWIGMMNDGKHVLALSYGKEGAKSSPTLVMGVFANRWFEFTGEDYEISFPKFTDLIAPLPTATVTPVRPIKVDEPEEESST